MNAVNPNKVLHIASGDLWAGAEVQLFTLAKTLHNNKMISVSVVLLNHGTLEQRLQEIGIPVIVLDESKFNGIQIFFQLKRIIREQKPSIIHTHRAKENIIGSIAAFLSGKIPSLRTVHGAPEHLPSWWQLPKRLIISLDWFCGQFLQKRIVAVSDDLAKKLNNYFPSDHICVIENGIDLKFLNKYKRIPKSDTGTTKSPFKVGIAGRLVPVKRMDLFIKTARYLHDHYPDLNASFHIFGDGPMRRELEELSQKLKTNDIVNFEGHSDNMDQSLLELNVLLITSDHEGLPMVLLEAMALQTPVIAHAIGGIPTVLDHGNCGILIKEQHDFLYAESIYMLAMNHDRHLELAEKAKTYLIANYSASRSAQFYDQLYRYLVTT